MLNVIVFLCGAALMALEIVAARVLAPALGNSIFVWGSVISAVMIALSAGYWLGGQVADRLGARRVLPPVIAGAGLLTGAGAGRSLTRCCRGPRTSGPRLGSLAAAALVFFAPSLLLAMVSPLGGAPRRHERHGAHRPLGGRPLRDLHGRQHRRHARDRVLAHPAAVARAAHRLGSGSCCS